jgi:hypothetical protein
VSLAVVWLLEDFLYQGRRDDANTTKTSDNQDNHDDYQHDQQDPPISLCWAQQGKLPSSLTV